MDCITISTFRNLEQQAIRQYKETQRRSINHRYETFGQEKTQMIKNQSAKTDSIIEANTNKNKINYFA